MKLTCYVMLACITFSVLSCSKNNDDNNQNTYEAFVPPAIDSTLKAMGFTVHKGVNPPNVEGTFVTAKSYILKSNFLDFYEHTVMGVDTITFFNQNNQKLSVDYKGIYKYVVGNYANQNYQGTGSFICGEGNFFTIVSPMLGEVTDNTTGKTAKYKKVSIVSGEIVKNSDGSIKGIQNYQSAGLMQEVYQEPSIVMKPNQGRVSQNGSGSTSAFVPRIN